MIGLTNPYYHELKSYLGYDITKLRDHQRFIEFVLARDGEANSVRALYFDGAVNFFSELPTPSNPEYETFMDKVYARIEQLKGIIRRTVSNFAFTRKLKH